MAFFSLMPLLLHQQGRNEMKRLLQEACMLIAVSLVMGLLYNTVSPTGVKLNRKPAPASPDQPVQVR